MQRKRYPIKRVIPDVGIITKKGAYGRILARFMIDTIPSGSQARRKSARRLVEGRLLVLHATKGWRTAI